MRQVLVSHKLREFKTGDAELDRKLNEHFRDPQALLFEKIRYFDTHTPDHDLTEAEAAAGVTPVNLQYEFGDSRRLNIVTDGATNNAAALQDLVDSTAGTGIKAMIFQFGGTGSLLVGSTVTLSSDLQIEVADVVVIESTSAGAAIVKGSDVSNVEIVGGEWVGEDNTTAIDSNNGGLIYIDNRGSTNGNIRIRDTKVHKSGSCGISVLNSEGTWLERNEAYDCRYAGIAGSRSQNSHIDRNRVRDSAQTGAAVSYGIVLHGDDAGGEPTERSSVSFNKISGITSWAAIAGHDATKLDIVANQIDDCRIGIDFGALDATNVLKDLVVAHNAITLTTTDTWGGAAAATEGISVSGYDATHLLDGAIVADNIIRGHGKITGAAFGGISAPIAAVYVAGLTLTGNQVIDADDVINSNTGIRLVGTLNRLIVAGNVLQGAMVNGGIALQTVSGDVIDIGKNIIKQETAGNSAIVVSSSTITRLDIADQATNSTVPLELSSNTITTFKSDVTVEKAVTLAIGSQTVDTQGFNFLVLTGNGGGSTVTNFTGAYDGQTITVRFVDALVTVDRSNSVLAGGANFVSSQYDMLTLQYRGTLWYEIARSVSS